MLNPVCWCRQIDDNESNLKWERFGDIESNIIEEAFQAGKSEIKLDVRLVKHLVDRSNVW